MFRKSSPYRRTRGESEYVYEEDKRFYGAECPVCGKPLSKSRPVCFACPIYPAEYYERKQERLQREATDGWEDSQDKRI